MQERREEPRGRTYLGGEVAFNDRCAAIACLVRNLSQNGAKLIFAQPVTVPNEFDMTIHQQGNSRRARIVWQQGAEAGVAFLAFSIGTVVSMETVRQIRRLEAEIDALARRVAELSVPAS